MFHVVKTIFHMVKFQKKLKNGQLFLHSPYLNFDLNLQGSISPAVQIIFPTCTNIWRYL